MVPVSLYPIPTELEQEAAIMPSYTFRVDPKTKRIQGHIDGLEAILQAVEIIMNTERFAYEIFNADFGTELETLIGQSHDYVKSVIEQRINEALTADNRINGIDEFTIIEMKNDTMAISFNVLTEYGAASVYNEVNL